MSGGVGLPEALERAASALPARADAIRPANGDPQQLLEELDAEGAVEVLRWLLEHEPADADELVQAWCEAAPAGTDAILRLDPEALPKPARKQLRRAHHRLRSRGVPVPERAPAATVARLPTVEDAIDEAMVSPIDPGGVRAVYLVASHPAGGVRMFELLLDPARGVIDCRVYNAGRSKVRRFLRDFGEQGRLAAAPAPPASARALAARAAAVQPEDRPLPRSYVEWRTQLESDADTAPTPGELARQALAGGDAAAGLARAEQLVRERELGPWPPSGEALQQLAEKLGESGESGVIASAAARRERIDGLIAEALGGLYDAAFGEATAVRFDESAYLLWKRGREQDARACLAAADRFRAGDALENPVARAALEVVLAPVLDKLEQEIGADADASPLVTPGGSE